MSELMNTDQTQEETMLTQQIQSLEEDISSYYAKIGQEYYETSKDTPQSETLQSYFREVEDRQAKIRECREQIRTIKGIASCKNCGADILVSDTFCSCCGARIISEATLSPNENQCPNCGGKVQAGQQFCTTCGMRLTVAEPVEEEEDLLDMEKTRVFMPDPFKYAGKDDMAADSVQEDVIHPVEEEPEEIAEPEEVAEPEEIPESKPVMLFCTNCGAELMPGDLFCTKCGMKIPS